MKFHTHLLLAAVPSMLAQVTFSNWSFTEGKEFHLVPIEWKPSVSDVLKRLKTTEEDVSIHTSNSVSFVHVQQNSFHENGFKIKRITASLVVNSVSLTCTLYTSRFGMCVKYVSVFYVLVFYIFTKLNPKCSILMCCVKLCSRGQR